MVANGGPNNSTEVLTSIPKDKMTVVSLKEQVIMLGKFIEV
jgi:hypothetical protein